VCGSNCTVGSNPTLSALTAVADGFYEACFATICRIFTLNARPTSSSLSETSEIAAPLDVSDAAPVYRMTVALFRMPASVVWVRNEFAVEPAPFIKFAPIYWEVAVGVAFLVAVAHNDPVVS
jgi:hypothetical protein